LFSNIPYFNPVTGDLVGFRPATSAIDGSHFHLLTLPNRGDDMYCSAWTPDDRRIVCGDATNQLFSMRVTDGGGRIQLTRNPYGAQDLAVGFSPDGTKLAFFRRKGDEQALMVADADGSHVKRLTPFGLTVPHDLSGASWSPDGRELLSALADGYLFTITPDGVTVRIIGLQSPNPAYNAYMPDYSPDGQHMVFTLCFAGQPCSLWRADLDGTHVAQLTHSPTNDWNADWAVVRD
jgi:Tol biopolymer transport system component